MSIQVNEDLVRQVASLARLDLSDAASAELQEHFRKVLAYIEELQKLETDGVEPSHLSVDTANVYRVDDASATPSLGDKGALANAPQKKPPYFLVPRIVGDADDAGGSA
jgi:aspartyl-tRNA(Asn)/glutamyl-tRNA(Gln) amidotransferase subunit C